MKRISLSALAVAFALCTAQPLRAQHIQKPVQQSEGMKFGFGFGASMPMGDYGSLDKTGLNLLGVFEMPLSNSPVHLRVDGIYSSTSHEVATGTTGILGFNASALYHFSAPKAQARPYVLGGLGVYNYDGTDNQTKFGYALGGGVTFAVSGLNAFAEARWASVQTSGFSTSFVPLTVGLMFRW